MKQLIAAVGEAVRDLLTRVSGSLYGGFGAKFEVKVKLERHRGSIRYSLDFHEVALGLLEELDSEGCRLLKEGPTLKSFLEVAILDITSNDSSPLGQNERLLYSWEQPGSIALARANTHNNDYPVILNYQLSLKVRASSLQSPTSEPFEINRISPEPGLLGNPYRYRPLPKPRHVYCPAVNESRDILHQILVEGEHWIPFSVRVHKSAVEVRYFPDMWGTWLLVKVGNRSWYVYPELMIEL
ncbi:MAG: hypothetical protein ACP5PX_08030 [Candidatus Hadarchaeum sp.]|uniref:hypothetical protein n=1 Tax=Candidatus Hadarchaeum sp. TaxID=2883567 RepID=UPI003D0FE05E